MQRPDLEAHPRPDPSPNTLHHPNAGSLVTVAGLHHAGSSRLTAAAAVLDRTKTLHRTKTLRRLHLHLQIQISPPTSSLLARRWALPSFGTDLKFKKKTAGDKPLEKNVDK